MEIQTIEGFLKYYENIRTRTTRVVDCIPPERIEWSHHEDKFTLGDLVRHLAGTERYMFAENVRGNPSSYPGHDRELADGYEAVKKCFAELHHRGQIYLMLGMLGVETPPLYGLTEEEVRERSLP